MPEPSFITFRVAPPQYAAAAALAHLDGVSLSALMRRLLDAEVERRVAEPDAAAVPVTGAVR